MTTIPTISTIDRAGLAGAPGANFGPILILEDERTRTSTSIKMVAGWKGDTLKEVSPTPVTFNHGVEGSSPSALTKSITISNAYLVCRGTIRMVCFCVRLVSAKGTIPKEKPASVNRRPAFHPAKKAATARGMEERWRLLHQRRLSGYRPVSTFSGLF
jgi:hypothetical protein